MNIKRLIKLAIVSAWIVQAPMTALADVVKVGVIAPFSGRDAASGRQFREAIETYVALNGDTVNGHKIQFIYKDSGGPNPAQVKSLAQELIVRDKVSYLAGFNYTPNALAVAPLIQQAKVPTVLFSAAASTVTKKSDFFVRSSFTLYQVTVPLAKWAHGEGVKTVVTAVADFSPGHDGEAAFTSAFEKAGGKVVDRIRMPLTTNDYAPFIQRIKNSGADAAYFFLVVGPANLAVVKAFKENGLPEAGIRFLGTAEADETTLQQLGDAALGMITSYYYSMAHDSDLNRKFVSKLRELFPGAEANYASIGAFDGTHLIYEMVKATGATGGQKAIDAVKGLEWESPRGPLHLDPETRHVLQNVYIRRVEKDTNGRLFNKEFKSYDMQPDFGFNVE